MQKLIFYFWGRGFKNDSNITPLFWVEPSCEIWHSRSIIMSGKALAVRSLLTLLRSHNSWGRWENLNTCRVRVSRACTLWNMLFWEMNLTRNDDWSNIGQKMKEGELSRWTGPGNFSKVEGDQVGKRRTCWVWDAFRTLIWASGTQNLTPVKFSYKTTNVTYLNAK